MYESIEQHEHQNHPDKSYAEDNKKKNNDRMIVCLFCKVEVQAEKEEKYMIDKIEYDTDIFLSYQNQYLYRCIK